MRSLRSRYRTAIAGLFWAAATLACQDVRVVDFNTPEVCQEGEGGFRSFVHAQRKCGDYCQLCIETVFAQRVVSYFVSHEHNCVCGRPIQLAEHPEMADAGKRDTGTPEPDAESNAGPGAFQPDAGAAVSSDAAPASRACVLSQGYVSRLHAQQECDRQPDCRTCRMDGTSESGATAWAAVLDSCPCPSPSVEQVCGSHTGLTRDQARTQCADSATCKVCVERTSFEGEPRGYMSHACGCPDAYRLD